MVCASTIQPGETSLWLKAYAAKAEKRRGHLQHKREWVSIVKPRLENWRSFLSPSLSLSIHNMCVYISVCVALLRRSLWRLEAAFPFFFKLRRVCAFSSRSVRLYSKPSGSFPNRDLSLFFIKRKRLKGARPSTSRNTDVAKTRVTLNTLRFWTWTRPK